jgi:precorrin-6B methylase 1
LGKHYSDAQNYIKANQFYAQSIQFKSELDSIHLELQNKQSEALNQVEAIYTEIREKERQIEKESQIEDVVALDSDENPGIAQKIIEENHDWDRKYPGFESLNKTEKRVFVLTMENYGSKEIAHVLGVAVQYVRNVKSRLRKNSTYPIPGNQVCNTPG